MTYSNYIDHNNYLILKQIQSKQSPINSVPMMVTNDGNKLLDEYYRLNDDHDPVEFEKIFNHYVKKAGDTTAGFMENWRGYVENNNDLLEKLYVENNNEAIPSPIIGKLSIDKDTIGKIFEILGNQNKEIIELKAKYAELYERDKLNDKIS